jgi:hypothetical protein
MRARVGSGSTKNGNVKEKKRPKEEGARRVGMGSVASRRGGKINGGHKWGARVPIIAALSKTKRGGGTLSIQTDNDQILIITLC